MPQTAPTVAVADGGPTVNEVVLAYLRHAAEYYKDSPPEQQKIKLSVRPLKQLYGRQPAHSFDVLALEAVRDEMIKTLARTTANIRIGVIKRLFKWAASKKLEQGRGGRKLPVITIAGGAYVRAEDLVAFLTPEAQEQPCPTDLPAAGSSRPNDRQHEAVEEVLAKGFGV